MKNMRPLIFFTFLLLVTLGATLASKIDENGRFHEKNNVFKSKTQRIIPLRSENQKKVFHDKPIPENNVIVQLEVDPEPLVGEQDYEADDEPIFLEIVSGNTETLSTKKSVKKPTKVKAEREDVVQKRKEFKNFVKEVKDTLKNNKVQHKKLLERKKIQLKVEIDELKGNNDEIRNIKKKFNAWKFIKNREFSKGNMDLYLKRSKLLLSLRNAVLKMKKGSVEIVKNKLLSAWDRRKKKWVLNKQREVARYQNKIEDLQAKIREATLKDERKGKIQEKLKNLKNTLGKKKGGKQTKIRKEIEKLKNIKIEGSLSDNEKDIIEGKISSLQEKLKEKVKKSESQWDEFQKTQKQKYKRRICIQRKVIINASISRLNALRNYRRIEAKKQINNHNWDYKGTLFNKIVEFQEKIFKLKKEIDTNPSEKVELTKQVGELRKEHLEKKAQWKEGLKQMNRGLKSQLNDILLPFDSKIQDFKNRKKNLKC